MAFEVIKNDNFGTTPPKPPENPKGIKYSVEYTPLIASDDDAETSVETVQAQGWASMMGPFFCVSAEREGLVAPILCIPAEDVLLVKEDV